MRLIYLFIFTSLIAGCGEEPESTVSENNPDVSAAKDTRSETVSDDESDIEDESEEIFSSCPQLKEETKQYDDISVSLIQLQCPDSAYDSGYVVKRAIKLFNSSGQLLFVEWGDDISIIDNEKLPSLVFHLYQQSTSNVYHVVYGFETAPTFRQAFKIYDPTRKNRSDWEIEGFFESDGIVMIDRLEAKETDKPVCNACREYNVETYGWIDGEMKLLRTRDLESNKRRPKYSAEEKAKLEKNLDEMFDRIIPRVPSE